MSRSPRPPSTDTVAAVQVLPVLLYHSVSDSTSAALRPYTVSPACFDRHLRHLSDHGYRALTMADVADAVTGRQPIAPKSVAITFDDGFADFADIAAPMMACHGLHSTVYVVTGGVGASSRWLPGDAASTPMMDAAVLRSLDPTLVEIGAHSRTHPHLDLLSPERLANEVGDARGELERMIGRPVRSFAYPHGHHSRRTRRAVVDAGYESAAAVKNATSGVGDDPFAVARMTVPGEASVDWLERFLTSDASFPRQERLRTTVHRQVRRLRHRSRFTGS